MHTSSVCERGGGFGRHPSTHPSIQAMSWVASQLQQDCLTAPSLPGTLLVVCVCVSTAGNGKKKQAGKGRALPKFAAGLPM